MIPRIILTALLLGDLHLGGWLLWRGHTHRDQGALCLGLAALLLVLAFLLWLPKRQLWKVFRCWWAARRLRVYRVSDWAFIAARDLEEAVAWHEREYHGDDFEESVYDPAWTYEVNRYEKYMRAYGRDFTFHDLVFHRLSKGKQAPFLVGCDPYYA